MAHNILYYPTIEFRDYEWLWRAALIYDRIYRIVPSGYSLKESRNVEALCSTGEIGRAIAPDHYTHTVACELTQKAGSDYWSAAALSPSAPSSLLHPDKCDTALRELIIAQNGGPNRDGFLPVASEFAAVYMSLLARRIAEDNAMQVATDSLPAFTASVYFQFDGDTLSTVGPNADAEYEIAAIVLNDFLPRDPLAITPEEMLRFRDRFKEERTNFVECIMRATREISQCSDQAVIADLISDLRKDISRKTEDLRTAMRHSSIKEFFGIKTATFPIATALFPTLAQMAAKHPDLNSFMISAGVALGVKLGRDEMNRKKTELSKASDYSYLLHAKDTLSERGIPGLRDSFHEFIED